MIRFVLWRAKTTCEYEQKHSKQSPKTGTPDRPGDPGTWDVREKTKAFHHLEKTKYQNRYGTPFPITWVVYIHFFLSTFTFCKLDALNQRCTGYPGMQTIVGCSLFTSS